MGSSRLRADLEDACPEEEARPSTSSNCIDVQLWGLDGDTCTHIVTDSVSPIDGVLTRGALYALAATLEAIHSGVMLLELAYNRKNHCHIAQGMPLLTTDVLLSSEYNSRCDL